MQRNSPTLTFTTTCSDSTPFESMAWIVNEAPSSLFFLGTNLSSPVALLTSTLPNGRAAALERGDN